METKENNGQLGASPGIPIKQLSLNQSNVMPETHSGLMDAQKKVHFSNQQGHNKKKKKTKMRKTKNLESMKADNKQRECHVMMAGHEQNRTSNPFVFFLNAYDMNICMETAMHVINLQRCAIIDSALQNHLDALANNIDGHLHTQKQNFLSFNDELHQIAHRVNSVQP